MDVRLEDGSHLLQVGNREKLRVAHAEVVAATMDTTIGHPAGATGIAVRAQTSLLSHEAERRERRQPVKPLRRIGEAKLARLWLGR